MIEEDTENKDLLFLGTEFGLFISFNGGRNWMRWTHGFPIVPVRDIAVHPRENDLIIGTHGRSVYIIDDISPLREISKQVLQKKLHLFAVPDAVQYQQGRMSVYLSPGDASYAAENKNFGACITYHLIPSEKKETGKVTGSEDEMQPQMLERMRQAGGSARSGMGGMMGPGSSRVSITIEDSEGKTVSRLNGTEQKGINRVYWNFLEQLEERDPASSGGFRFRGGISVLPGEYTVKIKYDDQEESKKVLVKYDSRVPVDMDVLKDNYEVAKKAQKLSQVIDDASREIEAVKKAVQTIRENARNNRSEEMIDLIKAAGDLDKKLNEMSEILNPIPPKQGIADRSAGLNRQVMMAVYGMMSGGNEPINEAAKVRYEKAVVKVGDFLERYNDMFQTDVENFKKLVEKSGFSLFKEFKPLKIDKDNN